jgi:hypothetical protein
MRPVVLFFSFFFAAAAASAASTAYAGISLAADANVGVGLSPLSFGTGYAGRLGYDLKLGPLGITPEIGASCFRLSEEERAARVFGGGRLRIRGLIEPSAYWHYGYGWVVGQGRGGPGVDMGGALDLSLALFRVGAHAGIVSVQSSARAGRYEVVKPLEWIEAGLHAGLDF